MEFKEKQISKENILNYNKMIAILRSIPTEEYLLRNIRRVSVFKFIDALTYLSKSFEIIQIKNLFMFLLNEGIIFKVEKLNSSVVDISIKRNLTTSDLFIWEKEDNSLIHKILVGILLIIILFIGLFKIFPRWHKYVLYYIRYPVLGFLSFMILAAIVRLIVYLVTLFFCKEQCWIWPNLFADCGFFESFKPMYEWTVTNEKSNYDNKNENVNNEKE
ncbi:preprotein translocase subunit Sec62 [Enterocytozoon bieneusi H348]|nr:preprotein translocase subunit Sec62 [Enterocytozoon bieneusi H348]|eukprot:XP_002649758.1 preprotein translocase subunit Sec62 [Enterocytozoon bieneusi H348]